jgi:hypothetical protein
MLDYFQVAIAPIGLAINLAVQPLAARAFPRWGHLKLVFAGFSAGFLSVLVLGGFTHLYQEVPPAEMVAITLVNVITYVGFAFCFFAGFINPAKTSLRIRLFRELQQSKNGLSREQILVLYDHRRVIELRIERLLNSKQVVKRDGRYFLEGWFLRLAAAAVRSAKLVVIGKASEFA